MSPHIYRGKMSPHIYRGKMSPPRIVKWRHETGCDYIKSKTADKTGYD
jgi:hypothetical protein